MSDSVHSGGWLGRKPEHQPGVALLSAEAPFALQSVSFSHGIGCKCGQAASFLKISGLNCVLVCV